MPATKPHGYKRRHLFKVGDLVRWNRWHYSNDWIKVDGGMVFKQQMASHLGIVMEVYQSTSKARCWTAAVRFMEPVLHSDYELDRPIPLNCLEVPGHHPTTRVVPG